MTEQLTDEEILAAVHDALDAGERDLMAGGIPLQPVADRVPASRSWVHKRLCDLVDRGLLTAVYGADPETYEPRKSYLPPGHPEADRP